MPHSVALILAGGEGSRMNMSIPKQYVMVDGQTVLQHTMCAFQQHQLVSNIYVVASLRWQDSVTQMAKDAGITKFRPCIDAGSTSFLSLRNGIAALAQHENDDTIVLVHDAVRPLVSQDVISRNIAVCLTHGNAITALESHEAFLVSRDGLTSADYLPREGVLRAQTPHTFPLSTLTQMMEKAHEQSITYSQSLFTLANELNFTPLYIAEGDALNFKLTLPQDILIYQALKDAPLLSSLEEKNT